MSDTTEAAAKRIRHESPTVDAVCRQLSRLAEPDELALLETFATIFFSKASPEFLAERSPDALTHLAMGAYAFLKAARPGRVDVQVLNPDVDEEGWYAPVTVIRTNVSERPFIVDTLREYLTSQEHPIEHNVYPVLHVERDPDGAMVALGPSREGERRESLVHCEIGRISDPAERARLQAEITERLEDVVRVTDDFQAMVGAANDVVTELAETLQAEAPTRAQAAEVAEAQAFLRWLRDGSFVFMGYRAYDIVGEGDDRVVKIRRGSGLGILSDEGESSYARPVPLTELPPAIRALAEGGPILIISKTNAESTVHRHARMDYIGVKRLDTRGRIVGEHRFIGLFTSKAYSEPAQDIPILREKLHHILDEAGVREGSHDFKEINTIFNSMPKEELFLASAEEIGSEIRTVLTSYLSQGVRVSLRSDPLHRGVGVMVILPKDRFSGEVRREIEAALVGTFKGDVLNYRLALGEGSQARLHFYMEADEEALAQVRAEDLEAHLRELTRSWEDRVREALEHVRPADEARRLARAYGADFSPEYQAATRPATAVEDILELEAMRAEGRGMSISFAQSPVEDGLAPEGEVATTLNLYLRGERLVLSEFMPILEACGLRVIGVSPYQIKGEHTDRAVIYSFEVQDDRGRPLDLDAGSLLSRAIAAARAGEAGNDRLNALVVKAGLHWREVEVLRTYVGYAFQLKAVASRVSVARSLVRYPQIARLLVEWFQAKFDPDAGRGVDERGEAVAAVRARFIESLAGVDALADDRALRRLGLLVDATLRTNYYRHGGRNPTRTSGGVPYISLKFDATALSSIQKTRLLFEVYVRSARMEGIHLRGARVARGGIRWSDRPDDFRTEVLGLVQTQMVKNAVIVPDGSKGGFVPTRLPADPAARGDEAREQYKTLIRGLLDLTDNLDDEGRPVPPERVVAWDEPDPYLVVAADKGTARFSDVANGVAAEYGFWLGDAFASGGSNGYDHKAVGITARGGWECVKRHFREMGKDIQTEPFTVAGIGDMSGDVFGNGMLLSRQIRLVAAFDHRHIFIDPDPDPEATFRERERLFALGPSSWADYDRDLLSPGGVIVPRDTKEIALEPRALEALGLPADTGPLDGETLIRAVLRAPVELLWNGGIGTYVRAASETNPDAGDPANDAVRITAGELRCKVVGEGGNLGLTQRARIEYALSGGRINTDALDNSGGVDLSDREVNLKILLGPAVQAGGLDAEERNALLERLTDQVAELVLADNWAQSLAISLDELRQAEGQDEFRDLMSALERTGLLDRFAERLPTLEVLVERREAGAGLVRPELCVLLAYAKLSVKAAILESDLPDQPALQDYLLSYFPHQAVKAVGREGLGLHRLHREIVTSQLTNDVVDVMGATFVHRVSRDTGAAPSAVVRAWVVASRLADHRRIMEALAGGGPSLRTEDAYRWFLGLTRVLERTTRWVLSSIPEDQSTGQFVAMNEAGLELLRQRFSEVVAGVDKERYEARVRDLSRAGASEALARRLVTLRFLDQLLEILRVSRELGADPLQVGRAFYALADRLSIPWLREEVAAAASEDRWEQRAAIALNADLARAHHRMVTQVVGTMERDDDESGAVDRLLARFPKEATRVQLLIDEIRSDAQCSLSGLSVAVREMSVLADRLAS